jgi:hypothetical protein
MGAPYLMRSRRSHVEPLELKDIRRFHILYTATWPKDMDMLAIRPFGAPEENSESVREIFDAMSMFLLIGKSSGNSN